MSGILRGTTKIDNSVIKTNEEIGGEYRDQLYSFLRDSYDGSNRPIPRNKNKDLIVINAYERAMKKLGLNPNTKELLKEVQHDNNAVLLRFDGIRNSLFLLFYKEFQNITHIINNKDNYIGKEIDCKEIQEFSKFLKFFNLKDGKGKIAGIGKKSIVIIDSEENKEFFWYLPPALYFENANGQGAELASYIIKKYGE